MISCIIPLKRQKTVRFLDEIARLKTARALLSGEGTEKTAPVRKRRPLSADARKRIAAAQRKRWAKVWAKQKATK